MAEGEYMYFLYIGIYVVAGFFAFILGNDRVVKTEERQVRKKEDNSK